MPKEVAMELTAISRTMLATAFVITSLMASFGSAAEPALKPGATVTVTKDGAEFGTGKTTIARLSKGATFQVTEVRGAWVGGHVDIAGAKRAGWILAKYLAPVTATAEPQPAPSDTSDSDARAQTLGAPEFDNPCDIKKRPLTLLTKTSVDIGPDGSMIFKEVGILAKDRDGNIWESRRTTEDANSPIAFFLKTLASESGTSPSAGQTSGSAVDVSRRYKWKSKSSLPFTGSGFFVRDEPKGKAVNLVEQGKGSIPIIGSDLIVDLPGTKDVHVQIDPTVGKTLYAGLTFRTPCIIEILKDTTVLASKPGITATDQHGNSWLSKPATIEGNKVIAFFMAITPRMAGKQTKAKPDTLLPPFKHELRGANPVRVRNPNGFAVGAGLRQGGKGRNFDVPANGVNTVNVPNGRYDIYFVYSDKPDALFQGDSFTLNDNGVEIQIVKVVNGNYGIRQVK